MNQHFEIPENWKVLTLEDISEGKNAIVDGPFGSNLKTSDYIDDKVYGIPVLTTKNLEGDYSDSKVRFISKAKFEELKRSQVLPGDILVAKIGSIGKTGIYPKNARIAIIPANLLKFTVSKKVDFNYVYYYINSLGFQNRIKKISTATAQPAFNVTKFRKLQIPIPPIEEQQAIVTKIEEIFSELDHGVAQLKTARQQLKVYRQAVLKWAFEGRLTNADENWKQVKLREVANAIDPQPSHRTPPIVEGGIPFVSIKDFDSELDKIDFTNARKVAPMVLTEHLERYELKKGDFVIGKIGTIGKPVRMVLPQDYALSANIVLIQPRKVNATYLYYFFQSTIIEKALLAGTNATSQAAFGIQKVRELEIQLPSEAEQHLIVSEIERRLSVCDKLEETIEGSLKAAEVLRAGVLKRAFEGRLL